MQSNTGWGSNNLLSADAWSNIVPDTLHVYICTVG